MPRAPTRASSSTISTCPGPRERSSGACADSTVLRRLFAHPNSFVARRGKAEDARTRHRAPVRRDDVKKTFLIGFVVTLLVGFQMLTGRASSHREAPLISQDPTADNTDLYAFVSPDRPD